MLIAGGILGSTWFVGCSDDAQPSHRVPNDDASTATADGSPSPDDAGHVRGRPDAGCPCTATPDPDTYEVPAACFCGAGGCDDYSTYVTKLCGAQEGPYAVETTYADCHLRIVSFEFAYAGSTMVFDTNTGAFAGGHGGGDMPDPLCESIELATGTYAVPASCVATETRHLCPGDGGTDAGDGGNGGDAGDGGHLGDAGDGGHPADAGDGGP